MKIWKGFDVKPRNYETLEGILNIQVTVIITKFDTFEISCRNIQLIVASWPDQRRYERSDNINLNERTKRCRLSLLFSRVLSPWMCFFDLLFSLSLSLSIPKTSLSPSASLSVFHSLRFFIKPPDKNPFLTQP